MALHVHLDLALHQTKKRYCTSFKVYKSFAHNEVLNGILLAAEELFKKTAVELFDSEKAVLPILGIVSVSSCNC